MPFHFYPECYSLYYSVSKFISTVTFFMFSFMISCACLNINSSSNTTFTISSRSNIINISDRDSDPTVSSKSQLNLNQSFPKSSLDIIEKPVFVHQVFINSNDTAIPTTYSWGLPPKVLRTGKVIRNEPRILNNSSFYMNLSESRKVQGMNLSQSVILTPQIKRLRRLRNVRKLGGDGLHHANNHKPLLSWDGRKILTILGLFEFSYNNTVIKRESGESEKAAAQIALDDVNGNDKILSGYKLVQITNDTQCDPGAGVDAFFHALYSRKNTSTKIISLLGTACSEVTERVAKVATHQRIVQVSFGSTSPSLSDRKEFPLFYRTVAPIASHAEAIIELITHFNWDTVSFFTENENQYSMPVNHLVKEMEEKGNITCKKTLTFSLSDFQDQLNVLNESDSRIIIASFGIDVAARVFCEVYKRKMFGPDYAWIWIGKPETIWWKEDVTTFSKSKSNLPPFTSSLSSSSSYSKFYQDDGSVTHIENQTLGYSNNINNDTNYYTSSEVDEGRRPTNSYHLRALRVKESQSSGSISSRSKGKGDKDETHYQKQPSIKSELECSRKELTIAIENTLIVDRFNVLESERVSDFGLTTESFRSRLRRKIETEKSRRNAINNYQFLTNESSMIKPHLTPLSQFAPETYDAVWTIALGLHKLQEKYNYSLENFNYKDNYFSHLLNQEIGKLKFTGISGPITFSGSDRVGITSFMQVQEGHLQQVGLFYPDREENKLELWNCSANDKDAQETKPRSYRCRPIKWPGNQVPISRREFRTKLIRVEDSLYIFVAAVAFLGILLAAAFLTFNLYYRKLKYIKLSSPRLNNMVIIGCMFAYVAVIILGSDFGPPSGYNEIRFSYICTMRAYLLSTAFSMAFGAMFVKTYRVHRIFTRSCFGVVKNKLLKDTQLMTLVMALLLIDVIIVTSWAVVDPMHRHLQNLTLQKDVSDRSVVYQPQIEVCRSQHGHVWLSVMYAYKSLLLVVGIYMAWETRHVKIHALNDSKNIAYCVYIVVLTSVLAVSLANLISERVTLSFVSVTSLILTSTTVTLCLLFLPKIHAIKTGGYKGDPLVESMGLKIEFNTRRLVVEDAKELLFRAEVQNRVYKRQIEAIDVEIWRLENLLLCSSHSSIVSLDNANKSTIISAYLLQVIQPHKTVGFFLEEISETFQIIRLSVVVCKDGLRATLTFPEFLFILWHIAFSFLDTTTHFGKEPRPSRGNDATDDVDSSEESEIYTVYLHGPRFIVPISVLNYQNPNATLDPLSSWNNKKSKPNENSCTLKPPAPPPRSSWPNIRTLLTPSGNGPTTKIRFKSEPKLVIEEMTSINTTVEMESSGNTVNVNVNPELLLSPRVTFEGSDDSLGGVGGDDSKSNVSKSGKGSRKSSGATNPSVGSSFLALLKSTQPFAYFSGMVRSGACSASPTLMKKQKIGDNFTDRCRGDFEDEPQVFHLHVPRDSIRKKFNSVPDLWAVRTSPVNSKKTSADTVMDTSSLGLLKETNNQPRALSSSNPVLKLTVTSDVSPYL